MKTLIIGERLNSSNKKIRKLFETRNLESLFSIVEAQLAGGAEIIDINSSILMENERDALFWAGDSILEEFSIKISVDSPDTGVLSSAVTRYGENCIVNSLTCDEEIMEDILPSIAASGASLILLLKSREGIPVTAQGRLKLAEKAVTWISRAGIPAGNVLFDPVFSPVATENSGLSVTLETLGMLSDNYPGYRKVGGLSNVSYGLPMRKLINRTFMSMALSHGITALICDPTDSKLMEMVRVAEVLTGQDPGCRNFLRNYRSRKS